METHTIFFVGKPGCGKGTQAKILSEKTGWPVISAGQQFRTLATEDTPVGRKVKLEHEVGLLQPHWLAMHLYLKALFALPADTNVIFDGFNRKVPEAELVIDSMQWLERSFSVIHLPISDDEVVRRIENRKQTAARPDDGVVPERLREYAIYTTPAIELFRKKGVLIEVDGEQTPEKIAEDIRKALGLT